MYMYYSYCCTCESTKLNKNQHNEVYGTSEMLQPNSRSGDVACNADERDTIRNDD